MHLKPRADSRCQSQVSCCCEVTSSYRKFLIRGHKARIAEDTKHALALSWAPQQVRRNACNRLLVVSASVTVVRPQCKAALLRVQQSARHLCFLRMQQSARHLCPPRLPRKVMCCLYQCPRVLMCPVPHLSRARRSLLIPPNPPASQRCNELSGRGRRRRRRSQSESAARRTDFILFICEKVSSLLTRRCVSHYHAHRATPGNNTSRANLQDSGPNLEWRSRSVRSSLIMPIA